MKHDIDNNIVYMYTNRFSGKKYIGITCRTMEERAGKNGIHYTSTSPKSRWARAIRKYGFDNFDKQILCSGLTRKEAGEKEADLIKKYRTQDSNYGYNICSGGDSIDGVHQTHYGRENGMWGNGYKLMGGNNGRATKVKLTMSDNISFYFDTQKECREFLGISKDMFRSLRDSDKPFEFSIMTNKFKIEKNKHIIGSFVEVLS